MCQRSGARLVGRRACVGVLGAALVLAAACQQNMAQQPYYRPLEDSAFFADGSSARQPVDGTVPREAEVDEHLAMGVVDGEPAEAFPFEVTDEVVARGAERFAIFCAPCHGTTGAGDGPVVQRGFTVPPPLSSARLRDAAIGELFQSVTNGIGLMPPYGYLVPERDRWAILAYVRALQEQEVAASGGGR